ncbi:hypothetical protein QBC34DRAFT_435403 [Podospora aff. communis PSN243]|uniref:chitinase n=1 Tax=Podospora aff. communis PSN243 TaxID=3040156 RepID=A0AAV9GUD8_9PEZI|nr:hypothetical protein QBC34DRAFT_435403 [Podospora aff. communis PSN243]
MLGSRFPSMRVLLFAVLVVGTWAQRDTAAVLAELNSLSDDELMRGTQPGGPAPSQRCPAECSARTSPSEWTIYSDFERFSVCDQPMLFDFAIYNPLDDASTTTKFRLCTLDRFDKKPPSNITNTHARQQPRLGFAESTADLALTQSGILQQKGTAERTLVPTLELLRDGFLRDYNETLPTIMFGFRDDTIAAVYAGTAFDKGTIPSLISTMAEKLAGSAPAGTVMAQLCGGSRGTESTLGAVMSSAGQLSLLQKVVRSWLDGTCATLPASASDGVTQLKVKTWESDNRNVTRRSRIHAKRAKPEMNSDGTCAWVTVRKGDDCSKIGTPLGITPKEIHDFNVGKTWGWVKCESLLPDLNICLSDGLPPVPYPNVEATCGPTVPGTVFSGDKPLKDYNPCPLNVCCNVWGNCGLNHDFCVSSDGPSPGTSTLQNGCISNCGNEIKSGPGPANYGRIGYYQSYNYNRACMHLDVKDANTDGTYTHIHWAFVEITDSWDVKVVDSGNQWDDFKKLKEKKIISFGGWGYSTEPATYDKIRQATRGSNRAVFAANVVGFLLEHGLDGVDFDWEYPGVPENEGIPAGLPDDGLHYLRFLVTVKEQLVARAPGKSLSIAAPASFWYLRAFPIAKMAEVLDYIVYMTYDLHGQWDAGSEWSVDGCPGGNCVRSHVNKTETLLALSMITKAGVPSNKIFVGESSYGRSFKLAEAGCEGFMCRFTGDRLNSKAAEGKCTDTAGYISDGEINDIIARGGRTWHDDASDSDLVLYHGDEWIAHMNGRTKRNRRDLWRGMNFAGTIDWAVDLQGDPVSGDGGEVVYIGPEVYSTGVAQCTPPCIMVFPPSSLLTPTTISPPPYTSSLEVGGGGVVVVTRTITVNIQAVTVTEMPYENYRVSSSDVNLPIFVTPSVDLPPQTVIVTGADSQTTTRTVTVPPWPFMRSGVPEHWTTTNGTDMAEMEELAREWFNQYESDNGERFFIHTREPPDWELPTDVGPPGPAPTWPSGTIEAVLDDKKPPEGSKKRQSCRSWFFFVCLSWGDIRIDFWDFDFPGPVVIGPGPPPPGLIKLPPGWSLLGTPKFPKIPIGSDGVPTPPPQPQGCTPTSQAELRIETEYFETSTSRGTVITTATRTSTRSFPILGCEDVEATKSTDVCNAPTQLAVRADSWPAASGTSAVGVGPQMVTEGEIPPTVSTVHANALDEDKDVPDVKGYEVPANMTVANEQANPRHRNRPRAPNNCDPQFDDLYVFPAHPKDRGAVAMIRAEFDRLQLFELESYKEIKSDTLGFTAFFYLSNANIKAVKPALNALGVIRVKGYQTVPHTVTPPTQQPPTHPRAASRRGESGLQHTGHHNATAAGKSVFARAMTGGVETNNWGLSALSVPPNVDFLAEGPNGGPGDYAKRGTKNGRPILGPFNYYAHPSSCQGTFIYIVDTAVDWTHRAFRWAAHEDLHPLEYGAWSPYLEVNYEHGTRVASSSSGHSIGVCQKATTIGVVRKRRLIDHSGDIPDDYFANSQVIADVLAVADDIASKGRGPMSVVNISWGLRLAGKWKELLKEVMQEFSPLGAVVVAAAGNDAEPAYPAIFGPPQVWAGQELPDMIVVGAATMDSRRVGSSQIGPQLTTYGAGQWVLAARYTGNLRSTVGTSVAAPQIAGLVAYLRGLPGTPQQRARFARPADVKRWIQKLSRPVLVGPPHGNNNLNGRAGPFLHNQPPAGVPPGQPPGEIVSLAWNGQVGDHSCLLDDSVAECPTLDINDPTGVGGSPSCNAAPGSPMDVSRRATTLDDGGSAVFNGTAKGNIDLFGRAAAAACPIGPNGPVKTVSIRSGTPSPTCSGEHCGSLCRGFYCNLKTLAPGLHPPDFTQSPTRPVPTPSTITNLPPLPTSSGWFPTSPPGGTCVSSATLTSIGGPGGRDGLVTLTSSGCMSWATSQKPEPTVSPPTERVYPYTWYVYATVDDNFINGQQKASGFLIFETPPSCNDVRNAPSLAYSTDVSHGGHQIRCPGCEVCMTCGNDWSGWRNIGVMELRTPSTWVTWYADRNNALVNTRNVEGGKCEVDTTHNFECWIALGMMWGSRQLKCQALFSAASIFSE